MRPWYIPCAYGVFGGPARVKCHSKRSDSMGAACRVESGFVESSEASLRMRLMVGDLLLNIGTDMVMRWRGRRSLDAMSNREDRSIYVLPKLWATDSVRTETWAAR